MDSTSSRATHSHINKHAMVSPPESAPYECFISPPHCNSRYNSSEAMVGVQQSNMISPRAAGPPKNMASLLSPPPSPFTPLASSSTPTEPAPGMTDPTLFSAPNSPAQRPLFDDAEQFADLISRRAEPSSAQDAKLKPTEQEYKVFVSAAFELCRRDPGKWLEREKKYIANVPTQWATLNRVQKSPLKNVITAKPQTTARVLAPARKHITHPALPKIQRAPRTPKVAKPHGSFETFVRDTRVISPASAAAAAAARITRQPATREDTDFDSIPDMCPPVSSLNENSKFRVEWKGTPLDLSTDPHRHLLHPAEVHLASVLRLSCASYLTSKRRIFKEKIERARVNMEFRKTDSQKACKIDVNKASKLWSAYEKIGWFDAKFIAPHL